MEAMRDTIRELEVEWALALGTDRFALLRELLTEMVSRVVEHPRSASEGPECRGYRVDHNPHGPIPMWIGLGQLRSIR
jgi:hypothetical protein